jgi:hypothetical protein
MNEEVTDILLEIQRLVEGKYHYAVGEFGTGVAVLYIKLDGFRAFSITVTEDADVRIRKYNVLNFGPEFAKVVESDREDVFVFHLGDPRAFDKMMQLVDEHVTTMIVNEPARS